MQAIGCPDRHVVGRKDNVVIVNFRMPDPPAPYFPGAGALRAVFLADEEAPSAEAIKKSYAA
jgi:hypothetical protein